MSHSAPTRTLGDLLARFRFMCLMNRHEPTGRRASWNGETYISRCEHCDQPIFRLKRGNWRRDRRRSAQR